MAKRSERQSTLVAVAAAVSRLPGRARALVLALVVAVGLPPLLNALSVLNSSRGGAFAWMAGHAALLWVGAALFAFAAVLLFEPPRVRSARAYGAQLRGRFAALLAALDREAPRSGDEAAQGVENSDGMGPSLGR